MTIKVYEQVWDEESLELGEAPPAELVDSIEVGFIGEAISVLRGNGVTPSASYWHDGIWYTSHETDMRTGDLTETSYHLSGFTYAELEHVYHGVSGRHEQRRKRRLAA